MQIFVPYVQPYKTARCLDNRRLAKQIIEVIQILSANTKVDVGWKIPKYIYNHPTTKLYYDYKGLLYLVDYLFFILYEYKKRKNKEHKCQRLFKYFDKWHVLFISLDENWIPEHLTEEFCTKHQQLLLKKDFNYYNKFFNKNPI